MSWPQCVMDGSPKHEAMYMYSLVMCQTSVRLENDTFCNRCVNKFDAETKSCNFADNIFKVILFNGNYCVLIQISLKFDPKGPMDSTPLWVQIMAWCSTGYKCVNFVSPTMKLCLKSY